MKPYKKILCATDLSQESLQALEAASELAQRFGSEITFLTVVTELPASYYTYAGEAFYPRFNYEKYEKERLEEAKRTLDGIISRQVPASLHAATMVRTGNPVREITRVATEEKYDLVVIATHGRSGFNRVLHGSVTEGVLRHVPVPVLAVHAPVVEQQLHH